MNAIYTGRNAKNIVYWVVVYTDKNGKQQRKTKQDRNWKNKQQAHDAATAYLKSVTNEDHDLTMTELFDLYMIGSKERNKPSTEISYRNLYFSKIEPTFGDMAVCRIKPRQITQWQVKMLELGLENSTLTTIQTVFRLFLNYAVDNELIDVSPFRARTVSNKNKHKREMLYWTPDEFKRFIKCVDKPILKTFFKTLYWTGMRRGEAAALTIGDIDFVNNIIKIRNTYDPRTQEVTAPKSEASNRDIEMTTELAKELKELVNDLLRAPNLNETAFIFHGSHRISPSTFEQERDRACAESGVKRIRIHDFRHSHVSLLINNRFTAFEVSKRLGHSVDMVEKKYSHMFKEGQRAMVARLNEIALEIEDKDDNKTTKNRTS